MEETIRKAKEELKRVDHLIYVSLKYTRTVDVIHNVIERLISSYDFISDTLLLKAKEEGKIEELPKVPMIKCEELLKIYDGDERITAAIKNYLLMRQISRSEYERENEYRRHVAMIVTIQGEELKISIDKVTEYYKEASELIEYIEHLE